MAHLSGLLTFLARLQTLPGRTKYRYRPALTRFVLGTNRSRSAFEPKSGHRHDLSSRPIIQTIVTRLLGNYPIPPPPGVRTRSRSPRCRDKSTAADGNFLSVSVFGLRTNAPQSPSPPPAKPCAGLTWRAEERLTWMPSARTR